MVHFVWKNICDFQQQIFSDFVEYKNICIDRPMWMLNPMINLLDWIECCKIDGVTFTPWPPVSTQSLTGIYLRLLQKQESLLSGKKKHNWDHSIDMFSVWMSDFDTLRPANSSEFIWHRVNFIIFISSWDTSKLFERSRLRGLKYKNFIFFMEVHLLSVSKETIFYYLLMSFLPIWKV